MNGLTIRQEAFAQHFVITGNGAEAARRAGYAPVGARVTASRLLTKANVLAEIAAERRAHEQTMGTSREQVAAELMSVVDLARECGDVRGMIAALREIGLVCGYYEHEEGSRPTWPR
ncbi:MAG: terminase small subunit [Haliea sp.]|uniref:terminase small subunit n=1 Tax=Haliea sp. TaxID=1932666 RepID=UPI0032EE90B8